MGAGSHSRGERRARRPLARLPSTLGERRGGVADPRAGPRPAGRGDPAAHPHRARRGARGHRERGGEAARELQILWILLPLARRLGQLAEFESDLLCALEIAGDEPRKLLALASLKAEFDLTLGRFVAGEKTVRGVLSRVLTADAGRQRRLVRELTGKIEEVPAGSRAALAFRLSRGLGWLHARGLQLGDPTPFFERAYSAVLTIAGTLAPELRHRYLFEISDHAAILAAASARHLVASSRAGDLALALGAWRQAS